MEISNKTFGIFCVVVVGVTVYVRAQSIRPEVHPTAIASDTQTVASAPKPKRRRPIPDSALPPDVYASSNLDQSGLDAAPVTLDAVPLPTPTATTPPATPPVAPSTTPAADPNAGSEEDLTYQDDLGPMADAAPTNNTIQLTDRDMLRIMLTAMPEQQRDSFRLMWFTMSPDDRQGFLDQLRGDQQGG